MRFQQLLPKRVTVAFSALRNDVGSLRDALRATRRPNVESRFTDEELAELLEKAKRDSISLRAATGTRERSLNVECIERTTSDSVTITFAQDAERPLEFSPGQFVSVIAHIDGEELRRAYSFCSDPADTERFSISVKRVAGGKMSNYLNDSIRRGSVLRVSGPNGRFGTRAMAGAARQIVLIAGGSGITPLLSIARTIARSEPETTVSMLFANRDARSVMHRDELGRLAREFSNVTVHHVLESSDEAKGAAALTGLLSTGRVNETVLSEFVAASGVSNSAEYYLCGPTPMMDAVGTLLASRGVPETNVFAERFLDQSEHDSTDPADLVEYTVDYITESLTVTVRGGQTVLRGGLDAGLDLPFSCTMGGCAACKVTLVSGEVEMSEPNCLTREEREDGYILSCIACPRSDLKVQR